MPGNRDDPMFACEDPTTMMSAQLGDRPIALPQSLQMGMEDDILDNPEIAGVYTYGSSYRNESTSGTDGRRNQIFPMIEFESRGNLETLLGVYDELFAELGFTPNADGKFPRLTYTDAQEYYGVEEITEVEEMKMKTDFGAVVLLTHFPEFTHPFWNMRRNPDTGLAYKCDVIVAGRESAGSAERETDVDIMRDRFRTIENGEYAKKLYSTFGYDRINTRLETYLKHQFFPRIGAGLGLTRILTGCAEYGLLDNVAKRN